MLSGTLEQSALGLFNIANNSNENQIPQLGRRTHQATANNLEGGNHFKYIALTMKSKETKKIVKYHEAFIFDVKHTQLNQSL